MSKHTSNKTGRPARAGSVDFSCRAPEANAVFVAGTFNDWRADAVPLKRESNGQWRATIQLPPGRHEFKFVVDGQWSCEPGCEHEYRGCPRSVPNSFGTMNRVLEVT